LLIKVAGLNDADPKFAHLWGRYVLGFRPWKHCQHSFEVKQATAIRPSMLDGTYELDDRHDLFYLCGVGQPDSKQRGSKWNQEFTNVHFAVRPKLGSTSTRASLYGVLFTIIDAEEIEIQPLSDDFKGLPRNHARCKNFQFGYQMFDVKAVGREAPEEIVHRLRTGRFAS
jgi:hypothetical protein